MTSPLLPELVTEGDSAVEALENVKDAFAFLNYIRSQGAHSQPKGETYGQNQSRHYQEPTRDAQTSSQLPMSTKHLQMSKQTDLVRMPTQITARSSTGKTSTLLMSVPIRVHTSKSPVLPPLLANTS